MITVAAFRKLALALPDASEAPHFEAAAFLRKGKIFATLNEKPGTAVVKLLPEQQEVMTTAEPSIFERVPNYWGDKGWTRLNLKAANRKAVESALNAAHANVTAKKPPKAKRRA